MLKGSAVPGFSAGEGEAHEHSGAGGRVVGDLEPLGQTLHQREPESDAGAVSAGREPLPSSMTMTTRSPLPAVGLHAEWAGSRVAA